MGVFVPGFKDIGANGVSFASALTRGTDEGKVVKPTAAGTVGLCTAGDNFIGVVRTIDGADKLAVVQTKGFVTVAYSGTAPALGYQALEADGNGGVQAVSSPAAGDTYCWVVAVDTGAGTLTLQL